MSEIRLVRCPKCSNVLPEPSQYAVYQCGACGAVLRAKSSIISDGVPEGSEKLVNSDKEREGDEGLGRSGEIPFDQEGRFDMAGRSPGRSTIGDDTGRKSPTGDSDSVDGFFIKSPMRDRFLSDLRSTPTSPTKLRNVSRSPMRENVSSDFNLDRVGRLRNASKSPLRESGVKTQVSVRTRDVSRSPIREEMTNADLDDVGKSPARSSNGDIPKSPIRRDNVSEFSKKAEAEEEGNEGGRSDVEEQMRGRTITPKTSFNAWLPNDKHTGNSNDSYPGRRRRTWVDRAGEGVYQISEGRESVYSDYHGMTPQESVKNPSHEIDYRKEIMQRDMRFRGDYVGEFANSRGSIDQWVIGRDGGGVVHGSSEVVVEHGRISASSSTADGPSCYRPDTIYGYGDPRHSSKSVGGPASVHDLQLERAELLQKYKELKNQLNDLDDKRFSYPVFYSGADYYSEGESWRRRGSLQQLELDKNVKRPGFGHHIADMHNFAPPPLYGDPFSGQLTRKPLPNQPHRVSKHPLHDYVKGRSLGFDQGHLDLYHEKTHYHHHPACSCSLCYDSDWLGQDLPYSLNSRISTNLAPNSKSYHSTDLGRAYNRRSYDLANHHPRRVLVSDPKKRLCHPISGGAPFLLCYKCFQLLKFPQKLMTMKKNHHQLQCGSCSAVMSFDLQNRSFGLPLPPDKELDAVHATSGFDEVLEESKHCHHSCTATSTNVGSYDFDAVGYSFQSIASETTEVPKGATSSSRSSKEERISDKSEEPPLKMNLVRPPPGSSLQDHFEYSSIFRKIEAGDVTSHTGEDKQVTEKGTSLKSSVENTAVATETEVHSNEVPTTSLSQDSGDVTWFENKAGNNKDRQSPGTVFKKGGFLSRAVHGSPGRAEVYVNGQSIPHRLVKKAEKFAGPIRPGEYWYDTKAGFWGVMGHRCLGMIPPFIQEFSFPMLMNCSGGDTAVYVNGRELHKRDLDLLASRGLPTVTNKSYIIYLSGKVLDEETKEFVVNLGKLAPSIERKKCGFGMQVPEDLDD